jgi:quercetin dioxygenase-like cupin family protein
MRIHARHFVLLSLVCSGCSSVGVQPDRSKEAVVVAFDDARFIAVNPNRPDSPQIAVVWGDPRTGPSAMLIRLKKGALPMHTHSSDYHLVVVQGTAKHWNGDETEADAKPLAPGSYWFQPANEAHADTCLTDECLLYLVWYGKQEGRIVEPGKK